MEEPKKVLEIFDDYREVVDRDMRRALAVRDENMYRHLEYFLGFRDGGLEPADIYAGKRFRSGLCLMLADMYGDMEAARGAAAAVELFHNFTLIHDDIADNDELRRGRETVWKKWGVDHAINSGDAQLLLSFEGIIDTVANDPQVGVVLMRHLIDQFLLVHEGQYLDFEMSKRDLGDSFNTKEQYYDMIVKKTSVLVGAATKAAGIVTGQDKKEVVQLWDFGYHLGVAYQLSDDVVSIWGDPKMTGKVAHNDVYEKKKTLPVFYAVEQASGDDRKTLLALYAKEGALTDVETKQAIDILDRVGAHAYARGEVLKHADRAKAAVSELALRDENKKKLVDIIDALLPDVQ